MIYEKQFFKNGNILRAEQLNKIEDALYEACGMLDTDYSFKGITLEDVTKDRYYSLIGGVGNSLERAMSEYDKTGHCVYSAKVNNGDSIIFTNAHTLTSTLPKIIITNKGDVVTEIVTFQDVINNNMHYRFKEDGSFYMCFDYTGVAAGEFFYLKRPHINEPIILYDGMDGENTEIGDMAMDAIMTSKKILVRVPNADGGNFTALYSPVLTFQLPNYQNNYLYLFYLKDEKQDLTQLLGQPIKIPVYGQLKLKLSKTYNQTPLA